MKQNLRIVMAQLDFLVGDIEGNAEKVISNCLRARDEFHADLIVFPELTLTSYPPEDLLLLPDLYIRIQAALKHIQQEVAGIDILLGYPEATIDGYYNKASLIRNGEIIASHHKEYLPNYSVFDEKRYFKPGCSPTVTYIHGIPIAIVICEDLWNPQPMLQAAAAGAQLAISLNASPFEIGKAPQRQQILIDRAKAGKLPILYVNLVGAQDELVFDGGSTVVDSQGNICITASYFQEGLFPVDFKVNQNSIAPSGGKILPLPTEEERIYNALVLGVRHYIEKNNFPGAILGLSGGIDSALTLAIAVDAIGKERVEAVLLPSRYTAELSIIGAKQQAEVMGVDYRIISIEPIFSAFLMALAPEFAGLPIDVTEQNLQARCRGTLLMALSNKMGKIVLATGNKSEISVGYSTLYGDMVGGFCVLKDILKTTVYRLARYRNQISPIIPQAVIDRAPSAELAAGQKDEDNLPPYSVLDDVLVRYIEQNQSLTQIVAAGFEPSLVIRIMQMVDRNEYKRRQAPLGVKISSRAFGRDRRYPITSGYNRRLKSH